MVLAGCDYDDAGDPPETMDAAVIPDVSLDVEATPDGSDSDASPPDMVSPDGPLPDAAPDVDPFASCPPSERDGGLRVERCRLVREGEGAVVPRGVVVSGDSLRFRARTPLHEPQDYPPLARDGFEIAWLLVTWDGIEPMPGAYNGAYLGRLCEHAQYAADAGLEVVLAMYSEDFGPAYGGHGFPEWVLPGLGSAEAASLAFWEDAALVASLEAAWERLLETCLGVELTGIQPLDSRFVDEDFALRVEAAAEARYGPLLAVHNVGVPRGGDRILGATAWVPGRRALDSEQISRAGALASSLGMPWVVTAAPADAESLALVEGAGVGWMAWHDGFGTDELALRDEDGVPGPRWALASDRTWPVEVAGRVRSFGVDEGGWYISWIADGSSAGLTRVRLGPLEPDVEATLEPDGPFDWFTGYDPITDELSVFVEGAPGEVTLVLQPAPP